MGHMSEGLGCFPGIKHRMVGFTGNFFVVVNPVGARTRALPQGPTDRL